MRAPRGMLLAGLLALSPVIAARADDAGSSVKQARDVAAAWIVLPPDTVPAPRAVHPHDFVIRQRLVPIGYFTLDADAVDGGSGKLMLSAGAELFRLRANAGVVECAFQNQRRTVGSTLIAFGDVRVCLRDADGDGRFEDYAHYSGDVEGLPSVNGKLPKTLLPLKEPVGYSIRDPRSGPGDLFVGVRYEGKAPLTGAPLFMVAFGSGDHVGAIDRAWARDDAGKGKLGATGTVLLDGSVLQVTRLDGSDATVVIDKPLPAGVFGVSQFRYNRFY